MSYSPPPFASTGAAHGPRLRWYQRAALTVAGASLLALLATAAALKPHPRGYGTHQRLGLPPCTIVQLYDIRCPSCGMTTSWSCLMRGQLLSSGRANVGGLLLGLTALGCGPWMVISGLRGKWLWGPPREAMVAVVGMAIVMVTFIDWVVRLTIGSG